MRKNLLFRFLITYFFTVTIFWFSRYFNLLEMSLGDVFIFSFVTTFFYLILIIDKKIKETDELVKGNYWQLKNELKRRVNGKEKKNSGKQVL